MEQDLTKKPTTSPKNTPINVTPKFSQAGASSSAAKVVVFTPDQLQKLDFAKQLQDVINKQVNPLYTQSKRGSYKKRHPKLVKDKITKSKKISKEQNSESITESLKQKFSQVVKLEKNLLPDSINLESNVSEDIQSGKSDVRDADVVQCNTLNVKKEQVVPEMIELKTSPWRQRLILNKNEADSCVAKDDKSSEMSDDIVVEKANMKKEVVQDLFNAKIRQICDVIEQTDKEDRQSKGESVPEVTNSNESRSSLNGSEINEEVEKVIAVAIPEVLTTNDYVMEKKEDETNSSEIVKVSKPLNEANVSFELVKPHQIREQSVTVGETLEEIAEEVNQINANQKHAIAEVMQIKQTLQDKEIDGTKEASMEDENKITCINQNIQNEEPVPEVVQLKPQSRQRARMNEKESDGTKQDTVEKVHKLNSENPVSPTIPKKRSQSVIEKEICTSSEISLRRQQSVKIDYVESNENNIEVKKLSEEEKEVAQNIMKENEQKSFVVSEVIQAKSLLTRRNSQNKTEKICDESKVELIEEFTKLHEEEQEVADKNQKKEEELVPEVIQAKSFSTTRQSARKNKEGARDNVEEEKMEQIQDLNEEFGTPNVGHLKLPLQRRLSVRIDYAKDNGNIKEVKKLCETEKKEEAPVSEVINSISFLTRRNSVNKGETDEEFAVSNFEERKSISKRRLSIRIDYTKSNENIEEVKKLKDAERQSVRKSEAKKEGMEEDQHFNEEFTISNVGQLKSPAERRLSVRIDYAKGNENMEKGKKSTEEEEKKCVVVEKKEEVFIPEVVQSKALLTRRQSLRKGKAKEQEIEDALNLNKEIAISNAGQLKSASKRRLSLRIDYVKDNENIKEVKNLTEEEMEVAQLNPVLTRRKSVRKSEENSDKQKEEMDRRRPSIKNKNAKSLVRRKQGTGTENIKKIRVNAEEKCEENEERRKATQKEIVQLKSRRQSESMCEKERNITKENNVGEVSVVNQNRNQILNEKELVKKSCNTRMSHTDDKDKQSSENETDSAHSEIIRLKPQLKRGRNARIHKIKNDGTKQENEEIVNHSRNEIKEDVSVKAEQLNENEENETFRLKSQQKKESASIVNSKNTDTKEETNKIKLKTYANRSKKGLKNDETKGESQKANQKDVLKILELIPSQEAQTSSKTDDLKSCKINENETKHLQHEEEMVVTEPVAQSYSVEEKQKGIQLEETEKKKSIQIVTNEVVFFSPSDIQNMTKNSKCKPMVLAADPALVILQKSVNLQEVTIRENKSENGKLNEEVKLIVKEEKAQPRCYTKKNKINIDQDLFAQENKKSEKVTTTTGIGSTPEDGDQMKVEEEKREFIDSKNDLSKIVDEPLETPKVIESRSKSFQETEILHEADLLEQVSATASTPKGGDEVKAEEEDFEFVNLENIYLSKNVDIETPDVVRNRSKSSTSNETQEPSKNTGRSRKSTPVCKTEVAEIIKSEANLLVETDEGFSSSVKTTKLADNIEILQKTPKKKGRPRKSTLISKTELVETVEPETSSLVNIKTLQDNSLLEQPKKKGRPRKSTPIYNTEMNEAMQSEENLAVSAGALENDSCSSGTLKLNKQPSKKTGRSRKSTPICKTEVAEIIKSEANLLVETDVLEGLSSSVKTELANNTEILQKTIKKKGRPRKSIPSFNTDVVETSEFQSHLSSKSETVETTSQTPISSGRSKRKRKAVDYSKLSKADESEVENDEDFVLRKPKKRKKLDQDIFEIDVNITPNLQTDEVDCSFSEVNKRVKKGPSKNAQLFYSLVSDAKLNDTSQTLNEDTGSSDKINVSVKIKQHKNKSNSNMVTCDVCKLEMEKKDWLNHKLKKHNNLAWKVGEKPLDLNDSKFVLSVLNEMYVNKKNHYYCDKCENVSRSVQGYLSHRSRCQKSTQDLIALQVTCEHCERVMLPVSMYTHLKFCRGLKPNDECLDETKAQEDSPLPRKRKAAEKASKFITALKEVDDQPQERNFKYSKKWIENYNFDVVPWAKKIILEQCRENGSAKCCFKGCEYQNSDWSEIFSHFKECTKKLKGFTCKLCLSTFETKSVVIEHLKKNHSDEFKTDINFDDEESNDSYDEENEEENCKIRKDNKGSANFSLFKQTFLLKFSKELCPISVSKSIVFPTAWKWTFEFCRDNFSEPNLFPNWRNSSLHNLNSSKIGTYLPKQKYSVCTSVIKCQKYIDPLASDYDWKRFMLFETSQSDSGVFSIFCGGSISAMAWLPTPYNTQICEQILAVAVQPDLETVYKVNQFYSDPGIIQFWNCGSFETAPKLQFCIAHDYNPIWCLEWCPSGCYDIEAKGNESRRLGILAMGSGNSNVYLYSVFEPEATSGKIIKMKPIIQLSLIINREQCSATLKPHVSKISWTKAAGHQYIAVGYTNGMVALYNLNNLSDLLKYKVDDELEAQQPYLTLNAHVHSVTALTLSHINDGCRWLMTASADRTIKYWDLREPTTPITSSSKFVVTDGVWLTHWLCSILCFDDSCNTGITQTSLHQVRNFKSDTCNVMHSNSAIQCIHASDWINGIIQGNVAGEIQAFFPHQLLHGMDNNSKHFKKKKVILSYCRVVEKNISIEERLARENEKLKLMVTKPIEVVDISQIASNPNRYKPEPATYKGAQNKYGVVFCDYQLNKVEQIPATFTDYTNLHKEKYYPTRPNLYPMQCVTKVQFNPNRSSYNYFAAGYQIGFVRIYPMKFITTK